VIALVIALSRARRVALPGGRALAVWGLAWFLLASATMAPIFPMWMPNRSGYGGLGMGVVAAALLGAAHSWLPGLLLALRLAAFAISPRPPAEVSVNAPENGAFLDFERLVRLQRFVRMTHVALQEAHPTLPHGARIGRHLVPRRAMYGFGEDLALQVWYRDTTLRWLPFGDLLADSSARPATIVEYQQYSAAQVALVEPAAMRELLRGAGRITRHEWAGALQALASAESLQTDRRAGSFLGIVADRRSLALAALGEEARAEREARRAVRLWPESVDARYVLARLWARAGRLDAAVLQLDTLLAIAPADSGATRLRRQVIAAAAQPLGAAGDPGH
jgi:tetratricopeptide (TPR) repeat protein